MGSIKNHFIRASVFVRSSNVFIEGFAKSFDVDESKRDVERGREKRLRAENSAMAKTSLRSKDDAKSEAKNTYCYNGLTVRSLSFLWTFIILSGIAPPHFHLHVSLSGSMTYGQKTIQPKNV